jgi:hypothetical protein
VVRSECRHTSGAYYDKQLSVIGFLLDHGAVIQPQLKPGVALPSAAAQRHILNQLEVPVLCKGQVHPFEVWVTCHAKLLAPYYRYVGAVQLAACPALHELVRPPGAVWFVPLWAVLLRLAEHGGDMDLPVLMFDESSSSLVWDSPLAVLRRTPNAPIRPDQLIHACDRFQAQRNLFRIHLQKLFLHQPQSSAHILFTLSSGALCHIVAEYLGM